MMEKDFKGIIGAIYPKGKHGPYAVASSDIGPITFSLDSEIWKESKWPEKGTYVVLSEITKKRAGWRAQSGRFFRPSDERGEQQI